MNRLRVTDRPNNVRHHRRLRDLTQADLASACNVSRQTIVSIEAGDYAPSVYLALRLGEVLRASVEELFGFGEGS